jgi:hypothetical protein
MGQQLKPRVKRARRKRRIRRLNDMAKKAAASKPAAKKA